MALRTLEGQATELGWRRDGVDALEPEDYLELIMHKTCWYTTVHPLRVGALIGSGGTADLRPMVRFGFHLGAAFQIQDDLLNLVGTEREYGKEIDGDLYEGKRTLPLIHLIRNARGARSPRRSIAISGSNAPSGPPRWSREVRGLLDAYGSIDVRRGVRARASPRPRSTPSRRRSRRPPPAPTATSSGHWCRTCSTAAREAEPDAWMVTAASP